LIDLMAMDDDRWHSAFGDGHHAGANYNAAWAAAHFMVYAKGGESDGTALRPRLVYMLRLLHRGYTADDARRRAFGDNEEGMRRAFARYLRGLRPTADALALEHQRVRADMMIELDDSGLSVATAAELQRVVVASGFHLRYTSGGTTWQTNTDPSVYFNGPDNRPLGNRLRLERRRGGELPDLIVVPGGTFQIRTRFWDHANGLDAETVVEPVG
jgi:hypothetical protein